MCNYAPAGNIYDTKMYKRGIAQSACEGGAKSAKYSGLCSAAWWNTIIKRDDHLIFIFL